MKSSAQKMQLASLDDLFSTPASRDAAQREKVQDIPLEELHPFAHHPFKVLDDDRMKDTTDASGTVLLPETVTWGAYFIEEIQAPRGYLIQEGDFAVFIGLDGDEPGNTYTVDIEIPDQPVKGRILANDSNFDRNPLRGCNYGLEGCIFDFRGVQFFAKGRGAPS